MKRSTNKKLEATTISNEAIGNTENQMQDVKVDNHTVGTTDKKYAQILDFAALQNILTQNVGRTQTKTYTQYTKEQ